MASIVYPFSLSLSLCSSRAKHLARSLDPQGVPISSPSLEDEAVAAARRVCREKSHTTRPKGSSSLSFFLSRKHRATRSSSTRPRPQFLRFTPSRFLDPTASNASGVETAREIKNVKRGKTTRVETSWTIQRDERETKNIHGSFLAVSDIVDTISRDLSNVHQPLPLLQPLLLLLNRCSATFKLS